MAVPVLRLLSACRRAAGEADATSQGVDLSQRKRLQIFVVFLHSLEGELPQC